MRTHLKHVRAYMDGYDLSGYERVVAPMSQTFDVAPESALSDGVQNIIMGRGMVQMQNYNGFLDNDTAGAFALSNAGNGTRNVLIAIGVNAAPAAGNPIFAWKFEQVGYSVEQGNGFVAANINFGDSSYAAPLMYSTPWGVLLHASGEETAANTGTGVDDFGAQTTKGGIFVYQLLSSDGTVTLKAQDASSNLDGSFADLSGATSGSIDASVSPKSGMVSLSATATVKRYLRWQVSLGTATTATFVCGFIRNNI